MAVSNLIDVERLLATRYVSKRSDTFIVPDLDIYRNFTISEKIAPNVTKAQLEAAKLHQMLRNNSNSMIPNVTRACPVVVLSSDCAFLLREGFGFLVEQAKGKENVEALETLRRSEKHIDNLQKYEIFPTHTVKEMVKALEIAHIQLNNDTFKAEDFKQDVYTMPLLQSILALDGFPNEAVNRFDALREPFMDKNDLSLVSCLRKMYGTCTRTEEMGDHLAPKLVNWVMVKKIKREIAKSWIPPASTARKLATPGEVLAWWLNETQLSPTEISAWKNLITELEKETVGLILDKRWMMRTIEKIRKLKDKSDNLKRKTLGTPIPGPGEPAAKVNKLHPGEDEESGEDAATSDALSDDESSGDSNDEGVIQYKPK
jgi:hypothetical protein